MVNLPDKDRAGMPAEFHGGPFDGGAAIVVPDERIYFLPPTVGASPQPRFIHTYERARPILCECCGKPIMVYRYAEEQQFTEFEGNPPEIKT